MRLQPEAPEKSRSELLAERNQRAREMREAGLRNTEIAAKLGITADYVSRLIRKAGGKSASRKPLTPEELDYMEELLRDECPIGEVAETLNVTTSTVRKHFPDLLPDPTLGTYAHQMFMKLEAI